MNLRYRQPPQRNGGFVRSLNRIPYSLQEYYLRTVGSSSFKIRRRLRVILPTLGCAPPREDGNAWHPRDRFRCRPQRWLRMCHRPLFQFNCPRAFGQG